MSMMTRRRLLGSALAGVGVAAIGGRALAEDSVGDISNAARGRIRGKAEAFLSSFDAPGLSFAFAQGGTLLYAGTFGYADRAAGETLLTPHRFRIASVSKPITASAIMLLRDRGELSVKDKVFGSAGILADLVPSGPPQAEWLDRITIDHLLTHTAGGWTNDGRDPMFRHPELGHAELINITLSENPLVARPGTAYAYSNFGYCVLGRVIERLTGASYADFVRDNILAPAGTGGMEIGGDTLADRRTLEVVYESKDYSPYGMRIARMDSHGGWIASAAELVYFSLRIDGYKSAPDLISADSSKLMATPSSANAGYGRGWSINPNHGNRWHTGSLPGTSTILVRVKGGVSFAGLVNTRVGDPDMGAALDRLMWDIHDQVIA